MAGEIDNAGQHHGVILCVYKECERRAAPPLEILYIMTRSVALSPYAVMKEIVVIPWGGVLTF